jgi:hypothetical protein
MAERPDTWSEASTKGGASAPDAASPEQAPPARHAAAPTPALPVARLPFWGQLVAALALGQAAVSIAVYLTGAYPAALPLPVPAWVYTTLAIIFGVSALGLLAGNRDDARAAWLGSLFALIAAPLAMKLHDGVDALRWMSALRPQAFLAPVCWWLLAVFPSPVDGRTRRLIRAAIVVSIAIACWCVAPALQRSWLASQWAPPRWLFPLFSNPPGYLNWLLVLGAAAPVLPFLAWRVRVAAGQDRRRLELFVSGLLVGVAPFTVEVLVELMSPAYGRLAHSPAVEPWIGTVIFGALAVVPFVTAYSVLFDRVLRLRIVLRMALQYALARYTIVAATLVPFAALSGFLAVHRAEPLIVLMTGPRAVMLAAAVASGLFALRLGSRWREAVDRRYFRESYDSREILTHFLSELHADSVEDIANAVQAELDRTLHAATALFVLDAGRSAFVDVLHRAPPLAASATIAQLVDADSAPMHVDVSRKDSLLWRLPAPERMWIQEMGFELLVAIRSMEGALDGMLALAPKKSGLPYSDDDRRLLSAIASTVSLLLDNFGKRNRALPSAEPAAQECSQCSAMSAPEAQRCRCGGALRPAGVPYLLRGVFRLEDRIGAGGMGVVYRAVDVNLRRDVAIKALPRVSRDAIARLRREGRSMAAVSHANLAVIHGIETWNGLPFLVEEYLAGGTLAVRLRNGPLSMIETLDLGITLADLLAELHAGGIVHCDLKPGNIGFTKQAVVKLLDFGLARVLKDLGATDSAPTTDIVLPMATPGIAGTPPYMSPEAARGERPQPSFDLWALGVVLYQALCGRLPFEGRDATSILARVTADPPPPIMEWRPDVPHDISAFIERALDRNPARRPSDSAAFAAALRELRVALQPS